MSNLENLTIVELIAENVKRLTAVKIRPDGALVEITGRNGAGKTSVLDAIWWALEGAKHIQAAPIRKGADKALIRLDLGTIVVTRTWRVAKDGGDAVTTSLVVENAEGARFPKPQAILDQLFGALTFDPMAFLREAPKKQLAILRGFVTDVDLDAIDAANNADAAKRTEINRDAKAVRARAAAIQVPAGKAERVNEDALIQELERAGDHNAAIARAEAERDRLVARMDARGRERDDLIERAKRLRLQAEQLEGEAATIDGMIDELGGQLAALPPTPDRIDTTDIRRRINAAKDANRLAEQVAQRDGLIAQAEALERQSAMLTEAIADRKAEIARAVAAADMPVPGLSFGEEAVMLNGLPLDQASDAEQLRTSIAIAMAMNPRLRVIRVRDGSLLDDDGMKLLAGMAEERGYQVWVERVNSSGKVGFVIEDGALKVGNKAEEEA
jgi:energy-coupling factor transporter ATP-binding protein EcfA2